MLEVIQELVNRPTQHADVRCTIHNRGLRFVVETQPIRGKSGSSIEHLDWQTLDAAISGLAAKVILEEAYLRAVERADRVVAEGPHVRLFGGPYDGQTMGWEGGDTIKIQEKQQMGIGFASTPPALPRDGLYKRGRSGEFHWQGWEMSNG